METTISTRTSELLNVTIYYGFSQKLKYLESYNFYKPSCVLPISSPGDRSCGKTKSISYFSVSPNALGENCIALAVKASISQKWKDLP